MTSRCHIAIAAVVLLNAGCTARSDNAPPATSLAPITLRIIRESIIPERVDQAVGGAAVAFEARSTPARAILLPGFFGQPPADGRFIPSYVDYEVYEDGKWTRLDVAFDGVPEHYSINTDGATALIVTLGPFTNHSVDSTLPVRVKIGNYVSESFTLNDAISTR